MSGSSFRTSGKGRRYDADAFFFAEKILPLQERGIRGVTQLASALENVAFGTPPGKPWSKSTLRRLLIRGSELGLMLPPRTLSEAARERPYVHRTRSRDRESMRSLTDALERSAK